jgi:hypothetical protein
MHHKGLTISRFKPILFLLLSTVLTTSGYAKIDYSFDEKEADAMIAEVVSKYQSNGIESGLQELEKKYIEYKQKFNSQYIFVYAAWGEAQTKSGTDDPAWGYHVFKWTLKELWSKEKTTRDVAANLENMQEKAIEAGFIGTLIELRELHIKSARHHYYGYINAELIPTSSLRYQLPRFPDPNAYEMPVLTPKYKKPYTSHEIIDISNLANVEHMLMNWRESFIYSMWLDKWGKTIMPNDLAGLDAMEASTEQYTPTQCNVYILLSKLYQDLGYYKLSKQYNRIVASRGTKEYRGNKSDNARMNNALLQSKLGEEITESIEQLNELRAKIVDNQYHETSSRFWCDLVIASKLKQLNRADEAYALLNETLLVAQEETMLLVNIAALKIRIDWSFEDEQLDSIEDDLITLLQLCRQRGLKASEPELYVNYARLMFLLDSLPEAIELQLVAIDQYKTFDLYTWLPVRYEELAELYFRIGNYELADYYSRLAHKLLNEADAEYPDWIIGETLANLEPLQNQIDNALRELATTEKEKTHPFPLTDSTLQKPTKQVSPTTYAMLDLQPAEQVCIPLAGYPATAVYTITNYSQDTQQVKLSAQGAVQSLTLIENENFSLTLSTAASANRQTVSFELQSGEQRFIMVEAPAGATPINAELSLLPLAQSSGVSYFSIKSEDDVSQAAVINAAMVRDNPFYSESIFHVLRRLPDGENVMNLHFKASQPARIEGYDIDGKLLFVDADGDGAFNSTGDILRADQDLDGFADIGFEADSLLEIIEITVSPHGAIPLEGLDIEVSHKGSNGGLMIDAIDQIQ